ncbi:zinc-binding alcohol dehydrogenase family protein [Pseudoclavibacter sp. CFCC 13611]|uniref:zinc-binding alcohol dehydrogenase family protein n=1 Tax=Pseudoclavibacter sp. CFCC 13611 TaxID=2615178 RepID=UPI0013014E4F|nr:zinc-binding alcohol dehydrogenase family protein [Pseudoclavibacter sp. CFCC 13611]KAB1663577.1 zinc-binding alcohol dehydrogenase family protein [Pseudoclavibacter sp. CFCC 13611]
MTTTTAIGYETNLPATAPEALIEREVGVPEPGPHDLLVAVDAVSVNPVDVKLRAGAPAEGFRVLGFDAVGTVRAVGPEVTLFAPGDHVFYAGSIDRPGSNQRLQLVDERIVGHAPKSLTAEDAAALPLTALTAWETLFDHFGLTADSEGSLLIVGATGGVGSIMVQLAEALLPHVEVIATASDAERAKWVRELGAEHVVNHHQNLIEQVTAMVPEGADWLFTAHSHGQIDTYAQIVRPFGQVVAVDDGPRDVSPLKSRSIAWHWEFMFTRAMHRTPDMIQQHRILEQVADLVDRGLITTTAAVRLSPISASTLREAHEIVETGHVVGKVVVSGWGDEVNG